MTHELLRRSADGWGAVPGAERWPMILVSWYGANAYSRWANGADWRDYRDDAPHLPTEAPWEYAARGPEPREFPWGDGEASADRMRFGLHERAREYGVSELPLAAVNEKLGMSPPGLRHMAGNVWQWCRDWYAPDFYRTDAAREPDAWCRDPSGVRSERGGSWVGPASLCRSSYRRGRAPAARGRCLGFRCVHAGC